MTSNSLLKAKTHTVWVVEKPPAGLIPIEILGGHDPNGMALEVAIAQCAGPVSRDGMAKLHKARVGNRAYPLVVVALTDSQAWLFGPSSAGGVTGPLDRGQALRLLQSALDEANSIAATQRIAQVQVHVSTSAKLGITNSGLFASHHLNNNVPFQSNWSDACKRAKGHLSKHGIELINALGFTTKRAAADAVLLTGGTPNPRAVAVLLDEAEHFDSASPKYQLSPVAYGLKVAGEQDVSWLILLRGGQIRLYPARDGVGVGQRGQADTFFELDLGLLADDDAGLLDLIFSAAALSPEGTTEQILKDSAKYATELGSRLKNRIYENVIPELSKAVAAQLPNIGVKVDAEGLQLAYRLTLRILFRLLFQAYAEDRGLLPYDRNERYTNNALKTLIVRDLIPNVENEFDDDAQTLWDDLTQVWHAIDGGAKSWNVPAYNGGLFGEEEDLHPDGFLIKQMALRDSAVGPALKHMFVDVTSEGVQGPVDFRSLSVREFGTIYEGLLESSLSLAGQDLTVDSKGAWVPAKDEDEVLAAKGDVYFHSSSGERKATGSYFTPSIIVDHLLDRSLEPALEQHFVRVKEELDAGNEVRAHEIFFDFRVADLAMGSGHFLVSAVDRIESAMRNFLVENPVSGVSRELERLAGAAREALGDDYQFAGDIDKAGLLRRQIARRCIYGLDINPLAVELSRLALWIHTFVPGLPMSSLDHGLVCANSLTGIGTIDEALEALEPNSASGQISIFEGAISDALDKAKSLLIDAANADEANKQDVKEAAKIAKQARKAAESTKHLFDAAVAARLGEINPANFIDPDAVKVIGAGDRVQNLIDPLMPAHMPYLFPEVFLRENPGFDVLLGNPPWEELHFNVDKFWVRYFPGHMSLSSAERAVAREKYIEQRPDLNEVLLEEQNSVNSSGKAIKKLCGGSDLYQAFSGRYISLLNLEGRFGAVLPRGISIGASLRKWRTSAFKKGMITHITHCINKGEWAFVGVHPQTQFVLLTWQKSKMENCCSVFGTARSAQELDLIRPKDGFVLSRELITKRLSGLAIPCSRNSSDLEIFCKMLKFPILSSGVHGKVESGHDVTASQARDLAPFDKTNAKLQDKAMLVQGTQVRLWEPLSGVYVHSGHLIYTFRDKGGILYRQIARSDDSRTLIVSLAPNGVIVKETAFYLASDNWDEYSLKYYCGILASRILDWFVRCTVDRRLLPSFVLSLPVPEFRKDGSVDQEIVDVASKLLVGDPARDQLEARLDGLVAAKYNLDENELGSIFATFHDNWTSDFIDHSIKVLKEFS